MPTTHLLEIHPNIIHPSTPRSPQCSLSLRFPHQDPIRSPIRATCPAHLILLDFITRTILGEEYRPFSSSLCSLLHSPVTSSLLGPNILLNTIFSNTLQPQKWVSYVSLFLPPRFSPVYSKCSSRAFYTCSHGVLTVNAIYEKRNPHLPVRPGFS